MFRTSPEFHTVWARMCLTTPMSVTGATAWNLVVRRFLHWATRNNRNVFPAATSIVDDNAVSAYLRLRRRWITQYLDNLGVLRDLRWITVDTAVVEDRLGITVNSALHCRDIDYEALVTTLQASRWRPNLNSRVGYGIGYRDWWRWLRVSETGVTKLGFSAPGRMRATFWYSIMVPAHPNTPPGTTVEDHVVNNLWLPIVRVLRFNSLRRNSTF